jgi:hypothetical protein
MTGILRWQLGEIEEAWIKAKVHPWSIRDGCRLGHPAIQTGYDGRGLPKFRVPSGRQLWQDSVDAVPG